MQLTRHDRRRQADQISEGTTIELSTTPAPDDANASKIEKHEEQPAAEAPPRAITGWKWTVASIAILFSIFLYALDGTVVAVLQATIVREFDTLNDLSWNNVGFLMGATATNIFWGQVYDQFDWKWVYIANVLIFEIGSANCGAALIVGRVVCGVFVDPKNVNSVIGFITYAQFLEIPLHW